MLRRTLAIVALVSGCQASVAADPTWEPLGTTSDADWYTLKNSLEYGSGIAKIWKLKDLKKPVKVPDGTQYKSLRIQYQYDCSERSEKWIYVKAYSEQMGYGVEVFADEVEVRPTVFSPTDWETRGYSKYCKRGWEIWK